MCLPFHTTSKTISASASAFPLPWQTNWAPSWHFPCLVHSKTRGETLTADSDKSLVHTFHWVSWSTCWSPNPGSCLSPPVGWSHPAFLTLVPRVSFLELWRCFAELWNILMFFLHNFYVPWSLLFPLLGISFIFPCSPILFSADLPIFFNPSEPITLMMKFPLVL